MRVLLTGANGYLGRHVRRALRARGIDTVATGRNHDGLANGEPFIAADLLNLRDLESLVEQAQATHLLHLAWYVEHGKYWTSPANFAWAQASLALVEAFQRHGGQRVVAAGTCAEYDWEYGYMREDVTPYRPALPYGVAKSATRQLLQSLCAVQGLEFAWGHVFFPFGLDESRQRLVPSLIRVFRDGATPFGINSNAYRGMLPVGDVANAFTALLESPMQGAFNICSGKPTCLGEVVRTVARLCQADPEIVLQLASERPSDPALLVGDNSRLRSTGWLQTTSLEQCLQATLLQAFP